MSGKILPYSEFLEVLDRAPWPVLEILIVTMSSVCLAVRKASGEDESYQGMRQLPGGFLLKGESIKEGLRRLIEKEVLDGLGINIEDFPTPLPGGFVYNNPKEERGHLVHMPWVTDLTTRPRVLNRFLRVDPWSFFYYADLPNDTIPHHVKIIQEYFARRNNQTRLVGLVVADYKANSPNGREFFTRRELAEHVQGVLNLPYKEAELAVFRTHPSLD